MLTGALSDGTGVFAYFILVGLHPDMTPVFPMFMFVVTGCVIANLFMNVFALAVDTSLQSFIAAEEMGGDQQGHCFTTDPEVLWRLCTVF